MLSERRSRALAVVAALVGALAVATTNIGPARAAVPIPPGPNDSQVADFIGSEVAARPFHQFRVPEAPFMAANGLNSMHNDAYSTDAYAVTGPLGHNLQVTTATYGVELCATVTFNKAGQIVALCGGGEGSRLMLLDPETLDVLTAFWLPIRKPSTTLPTEDLCGGAYFYLDDQDRAVIETTIGQIWVVSLNDGPLGAPYFTLDDIYDVSSTIPDAAVPGGDCLIALMPDWSGRIWYVSQGGVVGNVDPTSGAVKSIALDGEMIVNSFSTDPSGGVYIVSDHALYRFDAKPDGTPKVTWRETYDRGTTKKVGQLSQGSGATPTLVGRRYVTIFDNAEPRMRVLSFKRTKRHVKHRLVCKVPIFKAGASASENSPVAVGGSIIVENNFGYSGPAAVAFGGSTAPGIVRVGVTKRRCGVIWSSPEISPSMVPKVSLGAGLLYLYTKPAGDTNDPFYFTALDVRTGKTVYKKLTGTFEAYNNHYSPSYLGPDGAFYIATLGGFIRIKDGQ